MREIKREALMEKGKINIDEISEYFPALLECDIKNLKPKLCS